MEIPAVFMYCRDFFSYKKCKKLKIYGKDYQIMLRYIKAYRENCN